MRGSFDRPRIVGRCYVCQAPVTSHEAVRVVDAYVTQHDGRPVRRLAHRGDCALDLVHRIGGR